MLFPTSTFFYFLQIRDPLFLNKIQFVGINALIYYSHTLFGTMGLNSSMQLVMSGVLNALQLVGVSTSIFTMDSVGRRKLLMVGSALMAMSHIIIAVLVGLYSSDWPSHRAEGWVSAAFLLFYMVAFGASWGPIPWAMPSGIFWSSPYTAKKRLTKFQKFSPLLFVPKVSLYPTGSTISLSSVPFLIDDSFERVIPLIIFLGSYYPTLGRRHRLRRLSLLRRLLCVVRSLDLLLCT